MKAASELSTRSAGLLWPLAGLSTVLAAIFYVAFLGSNVPVLPDEVGYLSIAKFLAGQGALNLSFTATYHSGQSLLLLPAFLLGMQGPDAYRYGVAISCLATAFTPFALIGFGRQLGLAIDAKAIAAAYLAVLFPTYFYHAGLVWPEATFRLLFVLVLWSLASGWKNASALAWCLAGIGIGFLFALHARALVMPFLFSFSLLAARSHGRLSYSGMITSFALMSCVLISSHKLDGFVQGFIWGNKDGAPAIISNVISSVSSLKGIIGLISVAVGQIWGFLTASYGIGIIGIFFWWHLSRTSDLIRFVFIFSFLSLSSVYVASIAQLSLAQRPDHVIYSRYIDAVTIVFVWMGILALAKKFFSIKAVALVTIFTCILALITIILTGEFAVKGIVSPNIPAHIWIGRFYDLSGIEIDKIVVISSLLSVFILFSSNRIGGWIPIIFLCSPILLIDIYTSYVSKEQHKGREKYSVRTAAAYASARGDIFFDVAMGSPGDAIMDQYIAIGRRVEMSNISQNDIPSGSLTLVASSFSKPGYVCVARLPNGDKLLSRSTRLGTC